MMEQFVKKRVSDILDSYPIGKEFSINTVHGDMYRTYGPAFLPSRVALQSALEENVRIAKKMVNNRPLYYVAE